MKSERQESPAAEVQEYAEREAHARRMLLACILSAADMLDKTERITDPKLRALGLERAMESVHSLSEPDRD